MTRVHFVLLLALIFSCLTLVQNSYESRRLFNETNRAHDEGARLQAEYKRLEAERQAQATHLRVEKLARERLAMRTVSPAVTHFVVDGAASQGNVAPPLSLTPSGGGPGTDRPKGPTEVGR
jgi:cell division protein FtsL